MDWRGELAPPKTTQPKTTQPKTTPRKTNPPTSTLGTLPGATFVNGVRPRACKTTKECFNRRIEVFQVSLAGTQTTDWVASGHLDDGGLVCDTSGGGKQTITLGMSPQPTALWMENGRLIGTRPPRRPVGQLKSADLLLAPGPGGKVKNLFDHQYQSQPNVRWIYTAYPVHFDLNRTEHLVETCNNSGLNVNYTGKDCGHRSGLAPFRVWIKYANLQNARPLVLWGTPIGFIITPKPVRPRTTAARSNRGT